MNDRSHLELTPLRFLDEHGRAVAPLPGFASDMAKLVRMYQHMALSRSFDAKAIALQRTGQLGTFPSALGQEAVCVGTASAMRAEDVLFPYYRDHPALIMRGVKMVEILQYWGGDERGNNFALARNDFPICVPIATQVCHAAGAACAMKLKKEARVAVTFLGDGATSKGDFYEAMNIAGVWQLPLVMVINSNQWAISVPREAQTAARTLAQKAVAAGIPGWQVDGNDVIAVCHAVGEAIEKARQGGGPALIEALTYRLGDHTTADDATRYRGADVLSGQWHLEPLSRLRSYLTEAGAWTSEKEERLIRECGEEINRVVSEYASLPPEGPGAMFDYLYAALPESLAEQRLAAMSTAKRADHG